mmetsp:Transcript_60781/g.131834  ORF Transcript_60781/g.131834 Transcript_60781/m.131834 type:complete len:219 (+) Transcript_60781:290-946(+)
MHFLMTRSAVMLSQPKSCSMAISTRVQGGGSEGNLPSSSAPTAARMFSKGSSLLSVSESKRRQRAALAGDSCEWNCRYITRKLYEPCHHASSRESLHWRHMLQPACLLSVQTSMWWSTIIASIIFVSRNTNNTIDATSQTVAEIGCRSYISAKSPRPKSTESVLRMALLIEDHACSWLPKSTYAPMTKFAKTTARIKTKCSKYDAERNIVRPITAIRG